MQTGRLTASFEGMEQLSSSITLRVMELQSGAEIRAHARFGNMNVSYTSAEGVKENGGFKMQLQLQQ